MSVCPAERASARVCACVQKPTAAGWQRELRTPALREQEQARPSRGVAVARESCRSACVDSARTTQSCWCRAGGRPGALWGRAWGAPGEPTAARSTRSTSTGRGRLSDTMWESKVHHRVHGACTSVWPGSMAGHQQRRRRVLVFPRGPAPQVSGQECLTCSGGACPQAAAFVPTLPRSQQWFPDAPSQRPQPRPLFKMRGCSSCVEREK